MISKCLCCHLLVTIVNYDYLKHGYKCEKLKTLKTFIQNEEQKNKSVNKIPFQMKKVVLKYHQLKIVNYED